LPFSDEEGICYSNEFDCRPEVEIKAFLQRNEKKEPAKPRFNAIDLKR